MLFKFGSNTLVCLKIIAPRYDSYENCYIPFLLNHFQAIVGHVPSCRRIYSNFPIPNNDKQLHLSHPNVVVRLIEESRTGALILAMRWVEDDLR